MLLVCGLVCWLAGLVGQAGSSALVADVKSERHALRIDDVTGFAGGGFLGEEKEDGSLDLWRGILEESNNDITGGIRTALSTPAWWRSWENLHTATRDGVVKRLLPLLVGGEEEEEEEGWKLHCSDAYKLCQADNNCRWKYWNYISTCSSSSEEELTWAMTSQWEGGFFAGSLPSRGGRFQRSARQDATRRHAKAKRRRSRRRRRRKNFRRNQVRPATRRPVATRSKKLNWKKAKRNLHYWMGKHWPKIYANKKEKHGEQCSSQCLNALLMLNRTVYGALLAKCDCSLNALLSNQSGSSDRSWNEAVCVQHQAKAMECRPRLFKRQGAVIGCTESRVRCENSPRCHKAQKEFLLKCSQVINGVTCTQGCREAMIQLQSASRHFNSCVCDGAERPFCHKIRSYIEELCVEERDCSTSAEWTGDGQVVLAAKKNCAVKSSGLLAKRSAVADRNGALSLRTEWFSLRRFLLMATCFYVAWLLT